MYFLKMLITENKYMCRNWYT